MYNDLINQVFSKVKQYARVWSGKILFVNVINLNNQSFFQNISLSHRVCLDYIKNQNDTRARGKKLNCIKKRELFKLPFYVVQTLV